MNRQNGARLSVSISETNRQKLDRLATEQNVFRGAIVDEALTQLFLPPAERPEAILTRQMSRVEKEVDQLNATTTFLTDLLIEFVFEWLRTRPDPKPADIADERARNELEALMRRVVDRTCEGIST
ncbi:hypothetical protein [Hyphomonas adhaerens]|uniref:hypothetical protein n=1 Tax=Hyphomonas adhaerens TaxID=81029 RepID=UPI00235345DF|nr:hypothetical protein [Hyphomonas adhaerens]|tara:strand:- start:10189 stop:10566 length:378 start_codon:yes stop_codon:yes gene_type:complete